MSVVHPPLEHQKFYHSLAMPCPYLPDRTERKLFTQLEPENGALVNAFLTRAGFRRSHDIAYRPACEGCRACTPVRIPVRQFHPSDTQRRTSRRNVDLVCTITPAIGTHEQYRLFERYQEHRHSGGDMSLMREVDYAAMIESGTAATHMLEWRDGAGTLMAGMLVDELGDGFSAVYSFFEPDQPRRSLGIYMVLSLIELIGQAGGQYLYLGYFIPGARKMEYKTQFRPMQALGPQGWIAFS